MPRIIKADWKPWQEEKKRFAARQTEGFEKDIAAAEAHIKKLREICPKDSAGHPHSSALWYLQTLQTRVDQAKGVLAGA